MIPVPGFEAERSLHAAGSRYVIGCDEVGRGAIAGPVAVGVVVIDRGIGAPPEGLRDSKLLAEKRREELAPLCAAWVLHSAVGLASPTEVDELGIIACLGLAGARAFEALAQAGVALEDAAVLLDGNYDYLSTAFAGCPPVTTRIKADQGCASVAAASVIAKVHRDRIMIEHDVVIPGYDWARNKGYSSLTHREAITRLGASDFHRRSWLSREPLVA